MTNPFTKLEQEISLDMKALEQKLENVFTTHLQSAEAEGSALEARILALVKEIIMTTAAELQGKINALSDKFSQVEADVANLVTKSASPPPAASGPTVSQDQLDAMGATVDGLASRADALVQLVVNPPAPTPATTPPTAPSVPTEPTIVTSELPGAPIVPSASTT